MTRLSKVGLGYADYLPCLKYEAMMFLCLLNIIIVILIRGRLGCVINHCQLLPFREKQDYKNHSCLLFVDIQSGIFSKFCQAQLGVGNIIIICIS